MSTDDLLDEATRLAESDWDSATSKALGALVERVQQAEAERDQLGNAAFVAYCAAGGDADTASNWQEFFRPIVYPAWSKVVGQEVRQAIRDGEEEAETQAGIAAIRTAERDAARGKLDKVRAWAEGSRSVYSNPAAHANLLAILDGKEG